MPVPRDHAAQALLLDRTHKPLGEGVQIEQFWRQSNNLDALPDERTAEGVGVFRIPIENQVSLAAKQGVFRSVRLRAICIIHRLSGWGVMPAIFTARLAMSMRTGRSA
jgi:hypothetical protein